MPFPELTLLLHQALEARLGRLLELGGIEGWQGEPGLLHQMRVASRRVRAVLDLVDPDVYPGFRRQERRLRRLTKALGGTRELDVHLAILEGVKAKESDPVRGAFVEHVQEGIGRRRGRQGKPLQEKLEALAIGDLAGLLEHAVLPAVCDASEQSRGAWRCLEIPVRGLQDALPPLLLHEDMEAMHAFRIQVKQLRYTLEILEPAFPAPLEDWLGRLKDVQGALGEHHDLALLEALLWEEQARLMEGGRNILSTAALDIVGVVAEERRARFERFCRRGRELAEAMPYFHLQRMLISDPDPGREGLS
jgi:CHAD domain-containing protein